MPSANRFVVFRDCRETESGINAKNHRFGPNSKNCCSESNFNNLSCDESDRSFNDGGKRVRVLQRRTLMGSVTMLVGLLTAMMVATGVAMVQAETYFDTSGRNLYQLNVLSEYDLERYAFPPELPTSEEEVLNQVDDGEDTILYRISSGPKSPKMPGKKPVFIENAILCDRDPCEVNKPKIAVAYILVDRGYDVWLGIGNSTIAHSTVSMEKEKKRLEHVAQCILITAQVEELTVMGHFNGSVQFFGMTAPRMIKEKKSRIYSWISHIPGMKTLENMYKKGTGYIKQGYNKVVGNIDQIGRKITYITDDSNIRELKNVVMKAWGFMISMVLPTLTIQDFSKMMDHPDVNLDTAQLVRKHGYLSESHQIETEDGYLLTVHRIPGCAKNPPRSGKPVVLIQHGLLSSSADWVMLGPNHSLGYILSDAGYDVWMGNSRGNTYSKAHVNVSTYYSKYWEFSWHELGIYDLPATIDHVLNHTGSKSLFYVGHSQGATSLLVMLADRPQYNEKIDKAVVLAPVANITHSRSPIIGIFAKIPTSLYYVIRFFGVNDFLPTNALLTKIGREACEARSPYQVVCSNVLFMITGYDASLLNKATIPIILGHVPAGSSIKQLYHYAQLHNSKKFRKFDYGSAEINQVFYNKSEPPEYNLNNVEIPISIFYAENDLVSDAKDVEDLAGQLKNVEMLRKVEDAHFNHIGFTYAVQAPKLIYEPIVKSFDRLLKVKKSLAVE